SEDAVRHTTAHIRISCCGEQTSASTLADAEEADSTRIRVRPGFQVGKCCPRVGDFESGYPLERFVACLVLAITLAARLKCEDVETGFQQVLAVRLTGPAIRTELEPEQDDPAPPLRCLQVAAAKHVPVFGRETHFFSVWQWLATRDNKQRL